MRRQSLLISLLLLVSGCAPLGFPMVRRLEPDQQKQVDSAWNAMFTPVKRLDRQTLLDCVVMMQLYQFGVDRFSAKSTKQTAAGKVEMTIEFDRSKPQSDQFTFKVLGPWGQTLRREKWSAKELFEIYALDENERYAHVPEDDPRNSEMAKRLRRFQAATQPGTR